MSQHESAVAKIVREWFPGRNNVGLRRRVREAWIESETLEGIRRTVALSPSGLVSLNAAQRELREHCSAAVTPSFYVVVDDSAENAQLGYDVRFRSQDEAAAAAEAFRSVHGREHGATICMSDESSTTTFGRWNVQGW
jgi:hypothetical protein